MGEPTNGGTDRRAFDVLFAAGAIGPRSDAHLLRLDSTPEAGSSDAEFAALLERHEPMVLGVCRRILRDEHAAEDALAACSPRPR